MTNKQSKDILLQMKKELSVMQRRVDFAKRFIPIISEKDIKLLEDEIIRLRSLIETSSKYN